MAVNTSPPFVLTGFGSPASFSANCTDLAAGTGTTLIVTGGTNGSLVPLIQFTATATANPTLIAIFHKSSSVYRLVGTVQVAPAGSIAPSDAVPPWVGYWTNPQGWRGILKNGDSYYAGALTGSTVYHAYCAGGDL